MQYIGGETNRLEGQMIGERLRKLREGNKFSCGSCPAWRRCHTRPSAAWRTDQGHGSLPVMMDLPTAPGVLPDDLAGMDKLYGGTEGQYKPVRWRSLRHAPDRRTPAPLVEHELQRYHSMSEVGLNLVGSVPAHHPRCFHSCQGVSIAAKRRSANVDNVNIALRIWLWSPGRFHSCQGCRSQLTAPM